MFSLSPATLRTYLLQLQSMFSLMAKNARSIVWVGMVFLCCAICFLFLFKIFIQVVDGKQQCNLQWPNGWDAAMLSSAYPVYSSASEKSLRYCHTSRLLSPYLDIFHPLVEQLAGRFLYQLCCACVIFRDHATLVCNIRILRMCNAILRLCKILRLRGTYW